VEQVEHRGENPRINEYEMPDDFAREQSSAFKTSFLGFDKDDVISYIDKLVRDVSEQKDSIEASLTRLTGQNRDLIERINRYEHEIHTVKIQLDDEKQYNANAYEREELFKRAVAILQEKVAFLQNNTVSPTGGIDVSFEEQTQRANEIVLKLREELLRKDESISKMSEELSRRNDIILNQDKILSAKDSQINAHVRALEEAKRQISARIAEVQRMSEQVAMLTSRVSLLEEKRGEALNELNEARNRIRAAFAHHQNDRAEIERMRLRQKEDWNTLEQIRAQQLAERNERDKYKAQLRNQTEQISELKARLIAEKDQAAREMYAREAMLSENKRRTYESEAETRDRYARYRRQPVYTSAYDDYMEPQAAPRESYDAANSLNRRYEGYEHYDREQGVNRRSYDTDPLFREDFRQERYADSGYRPQEPINQYRTGSPYIYKAPPERETPYYSDSLFRPARDAVPEEPPRDDYPPYPRYPY